MIRINIIIFFFLEIGFSLTNPSNSFRNFGPIRPLSIQRMENFLSSPFEMCQLSWNRGFLSRVERFSQTNSSEWGAPLTFFALSLPPPSLEPLISIEAVQPRHLGYRFSDETWRTVSIRQESVRGPFRGPRLSSERPRSRETRDRWTGEIRWEGNESLPNSIDTEIEIRETLVRSLDIFDPLHTISFAKRFVTNDEKKWEINVKQVTKDNKSSRYTWSFGNFKRIYCNYITVDGVLILFSNLQCKWTKRSR